MNLFKLNNATRTIRNADNGANQGGGFGGATTHPFESSGTNVFDQMSKGTGVEQNGMVAPAMNNQGMPASTNPPPLESMQINNTPQLHPNQGMPASTNPQAPAPAPQGGSPLDIYNPMQDNSTLGNPATPAVQEAAAPKSLFDTDLKGWEKATANIDLAAGIEPEKVQLALSGTPESAGALMDIIQQVARSAMTQSAHMSARVAQSGMNTGMEAFGKTVPGMITDHEFGGMWKGNNVMSHASAKPMVDALTTQFRTQWPNASVQEIQGQVEHYMTTFAAANSGQQAAAEPEKVETPKGQMSLTDFFSG